MSIKKLFIKGRIACAYYMYHTEILPTSLSRFSLSVLCDHFNFTFRLFSIPHTPIKISFCKNYILLFFHFVLHKMMDFICDPSSLTSSSISIRFYGWCFFFIWKIIFSLHNLFFTVLCSISSFIWVSVCWFVVCAHDSYYLKM